MGGDVKIICGMLSYLMPELTDKTVQQLVKEGFTLGKDLFVFENGQPGPGVSKAATHFTGSNLRMTGGFNFICNWVADEADHVPDVLWLCTNDFDITELRVLHDGKPLPDLIQQAFEYPGPRGNERPLGWWHPSLEPIPGYAYPWMFNRDASWTRAVQMTDFICPAVSWDAMCKIKERYGHWFEPRFFRGWGIDYETCYFMRKMGLDVVVDDRIKIRHEASKTYTSGAAPETKDQFYSSALSEMRLVMSDKYGPDWHNEVMG